MDKKHLWYQNEELVRQHYIQAWYKTVEKNYTIQWWEIDLLMEKSWDLVLIEVKTVNDIDELDNYITDRKIWFLQRTLEAFLQEVDEDKFESIRMDVVFVKNGKLIEIFDDITNK